MAPGRSARALLWLAAAALAAAGGGSRAGETLAGPVRARVLDVIDGDTIAVAARIWLGQEVAVMVRLAGIDAPELKGRCAAERQAAEAARALVAAALAGGEAVLSDVHYDKYGGRVLARVAAPDGTDIARTLLEHGLARPYGGGRRQPWCS
jgi:micrococcal nuclease